jgi:hypothetical protein
MRIFLRNITYPLLAFAVLFFAWQALAQTNKPLVVVRFNQQNVRYGTPLFQAIEKAVAVKSTVMFDVVSYTPVTGNSTSDAQWQKVAGAHTQQFVSIMNEMGVPSSRISVQGRQQPGLQHDEVHLFVR